MRTNCYPVYNRRGGQQASIPSKKSHANLLAVFLNLRAPLTQRPNQQTSRPCTRVSQHTQSQDAYGRHFYKGDPLTERFHALMRHSTGLVFVASLGAPRAAGFTMLSGSLRRSGVVGGARRGMMAFLGSTGVPSSSPPASSGAPKSSSRWASTVMSASAQSVAAADGPALSVHQQKESVSHAAYDVVEEDFVAEYGATTTLYKHKKSGAEVLSVQIDDDNKVGVVAA